MKLVNYSEVFQRGNAPQLLPERRRVGLYNLREVAGRQDLLLAFEAELREAAPEHPPHEPLRATRLVEGVWWRSTQKVDHVSIPERHPDRDPCTAARLEEVLHLHRHESV